MATKSAAKATKKPSPAKKTPNKFQTTQSSALSGVNTSTFKIKRSYVIFAVLLIILAAFIIRNRGLFVAAMVNGNPIYRTEVISQTEKQAGKQTINNLIRNSLIEQEARKRKVTVTEKEIDEEIKKVESNLSKQGQKLDQVLEMQGLSRDDLRKLLRLDKLLGKMVGKDIKVTDKEVDDYIEKNRESLPTDQTEEQLKKTVSDNLRQQKLNEKVQSFLADLNAKAKIQYFVEY